MRIVLAGTCKLKLGRSAGAKMRTIQLKLLSILLLAASSAPALSQANVSDVRCGMGSDCYPDLLNIYESTISKAKVELININTNDCSSSTWVGSESIKIFLDIGVISAEQVQLIQPMVINSRARPTDPVYKALLNFSELMKDSLYASGMQRLAIADLALQSKCLDIADQNYRYVIAKFPSEAFAGLRQRAQVGVDDVRSSRN